MSALEYQGHAIVSADGMIADADGDMPRGLVNRADQQRFQAALDQSAAVVLGRLGHARHPNPGRRRLVVTTSVAEAMTDPEDGRATLWNPTGIALPAMLDWLGIADGTIAVTGGTRVFELFLPHYTSFALAEAHGVTLPGGRPAFAQGHPRTILAAAGLCPAERLALEPTGDVTTTIWRR